MVCDTHNVSFSELCFRDNIALISISYLTSYAKPHTFSCENHRLSICCFFFGDIATDKIIAPKLIITQCQRYWIILKNECHFQEDPKSKNGYEWNEDPWNLCIGQHCPDSHPSLNSLVGSLLETFFLTIRETSAHIFLPWIFISWNLKLDKFSENSHYWHLGISTHPFIQAHWIGSDLRNFKFFNTLSKFLVFYVKLFNRFP